MLNTTETAHLHLGRCVRDACEPDCPRIGRPTGVDGRCACDKCVPVTAWHVVTFVMRNGRHAVTGVTTQQWNELQAEGRLVKTHAIPRLATSLRVPTGG